MQETRDFSLKPLHTIQFSVLSHLTLGDYSRPDRSYTDATTADQLHGCSHVRSSHIVCSHSGDSMSRHLIIVQQNKDKNEQEGFYN